VTQNHLTLPFKKILPSTEGSHHDWLIKQMKSLGPWSLKIPVAPGISTPGEMDVLIRTETFQRCFPYELSGKSILDFGCNSGYFTLLMGNMGASKVTGIDFSDYIKQAEFISSLYDVNNVNFEEGSVYSYKPEHPVHITSMMGLFYHLKFPFLAISKAAEYTEEMLIVETDVLLEPHTTQQMLFVEHTYRNDYTTWWIPGLESLKGMMRSAGFPYCKTIHYPQSHSTPVFGHGYSIGSTEEGFPKAGRAFVIGLKKDPSEKLEQWFQELPDISSELILDELKKRQTAEKNASAKDHRASVDKLCSRINELDEIRTKLQEEHSSLMNYVKILEQETFELRSNQSAKRVLELEETESTLLKEHEKLQEYLKILETENQSLKQSQSKTRIDELENTQTTLTKEHEKLQEYLKILETENQSLKQSQSKTRIEELENTQTTLTKEHEKLVNYIEILKAENLDLKENHKTLIELINKKSPSENSESPENTDLETETQS
jgi:FtsZ-binding cell division protein ZapB/SAM-dependent methyltransferase